IMNFLKPLDLSLNLNKNWSLKFTTHSSPTSSDVRSKHLNSFRGWTYPKIAESNQLSLSTVFHLCLYSAVSSRCKFRIKITTHFESILYCRGKSAYVSF